MLAFVEFCNRDKATIILIPIEEPITMITNINMELIEIITRELEDNTENKIVKSISILRSARIIFFRHQHSLIILAINKIFISIKNFLHPK